MRFLSTMGIFLVLIQAPQHRSRPEIAKLLRLLSFEKSGWWTIGVVFYLALYGNAIVYTNVYLCILTYTYKGGW